MSDDVIGQVDNEAVAMAEVMAGYNKAARVEETPAEVTPDPEPAPQEVEAEPVEETPPEPSVADELKALKAKVTALASTSDPDAVRRMHGEIGDINRTLKKLQSPKEAPAEDELAAAIKEAEASEFPEITAPLLKALKALSTTRQAQPEQSVDIAASVSTEVEKRLERLAREALEEEHPGWNETTKTPEFSAWFASKPPEYQTKYGKSENPAVAAKCLTEFKDSLKVRQKKQERLESAVTPQGTPQKPAASTISDDEALMRGYKKAKRLTI